MGDVAEDRIGTQVVCTIGEEAAGSSKSKIDAASQFHTWRRHVALKLGGEGIGEGVIEDRDPVDRDVEEITRRRSSGAIERVDGGKQKRQVDRSVWRQIVQL